MEVNRAHLDHMPGFVAQSCLDHTKTLQNATCSAIAWIVCGKGDLWLEENDIKSSAKLEMPGNSAKYVAESHLNEQQSTFFKVNGAFASEFNQELGYPMEMVSRRDLLTAYERSPVGIGGQRVGDFPLGCYFPNEVANFVVASSFVRLLGAWEQFEIDVLRCLMHHRPNGMFGAPVDNEVIVLDRERFESEIGSGSSDKGVWKWMGKIAESRTERGKILKHVYELPRDSGLNKSSRTLFNTRVSEWYDKRNRIAHGRGDAKVSLHEYVQADATIFDRVMQLSRECKDKLFVWL